MTLDTFDIFVDGIFAVFKGLEAWETTKPFECRKCLETGERTKSLEYGKCLETRKTLKSHKYGNCQETEEMKQMKWILKVQKCL